MFNLTPELLEMGLTRLGIAAGQLKQIDTECKKALIRFVMDATASGNANEYIKERLRWLESYAPEASAPPTTRATARVVEAPKRPPRGGR